MSTRCDCKPGTFENGWHEERGKSCRAAEREEFARAITRALELARELRSDG